MLLLLIKQKKINFFNFQNHLQLQIKSGTNKSAQEEIEKLKQKSYIIKNHEQELCQRIKVLEVDIEEQKSVNMHKDSLLEVRADYIRALQDSDNVNKARIVIQLTELEKLRKEIKEFDKFKMAHSEEKINYDNFVKNLEMENVKLQTKCDFLFEKR